MKYKLKGEPKIDIQQTVLNNRKIYQLEDFLNPPPVNSSPLALDNMQKGVELVKKHSKKGGEVAILVDCDADGYTSSAVMYLYLKQLGIKPHVVFHDSKRHGLEDEFVYNQILEIKPNLLIIPDASSNEADIHNELSEQMDILVLDHHLADNTGQSKAVIINNQISENFPNKDLSGVGIVYKFIQQLDKELGLTMADVPLDLVAVGSISDMMNLYNLETRYLVLKGLNQICNPFLKEIKATENIDNFTITDIGFKVAPIINSIIRVGTFEEKKMLFDAMVGMDYTIDYTPRGKQKTTQTVQQAIIRMGKNAKSRQNNMVKKSVVILKNQIEDNNLIENKVLILNTTGVFQKTEISGLVATKLATEYKRPVLLLSERTGDLFGGSARGFGIDNFKQICEDTGLPEYAEGHCSAFGLEIYRENINKLSPIFNEVLKDIELELCHEVDYVIDAKYLKVTHIESIADLEPLWGCTISEPLFLVKNVKVNSGMVRKFGLLVSFQSNGIQYSKNYATNSYVDEFTCGKERGLKNADLNVDIICRFKKYKNTYFCEIVDYKSTISLDLVF